jgi:transcription factor IIIB subunit 2
MDFSKLLHINIYTLGSCYLKIIEKLNFHNSKPDIPLLDPQIYIHKFCSKLNFGEKERKVNETANKFLACLKRD